MKMARVAARRLFPIPFLLLLVFGANTPVRAAQLIANGDFGLGNVAFTSGYTYRPGNILDVQIYDVVTNPHNSHGDAASYGDHTTGSGLMMAINGAMTAGTVVWSETISVRPNSSYAFSTWASSWVAISSARLDFRFNGASIGTFTAPTSAGNWQQFSTSWNSMSNSSVTIQIIDNNTDFSGNDFALDDVSLDGPAPQVVPEPHGLALLGCGALGAVLYRHLRPAA